MPIDVFLSVGKTSNERQEAFVAGIEQSLRDRDLRPRTLGRNEWSSLQPLQAIKERMDECSGAAIVAFERLYIADGLEKRGGDDERPIRGEVRTTIWNQMEAAMAYVLGLPLIVFAEEGIRVEGVLEPRDWAVQWLGLDPAALQTPQSMGVIDDWKNHVVAFAESRPRKAASPRQGGQRADRETSW
jgi:hypothetical protein